MGNCINYCVYNRVNGGTRRFSDTHFNLLPKSCAVCIHKLLAQTYCGEI